MGEKKLDSGATVSRRTAIQTLAATGVALTGVQGVAGKAERMKRIVTERQGGEALVTKRVPRRWYEYERRVDQKRQRLETRFNETPGVDDVTVRPSEKTVGGRTGSKLAVKTESEADASALSVPESVDGVPVATVEAPNERRLLGHSGCHNKSDYDSVPGGVNIQGITSDNRYMNGTSTCRVEKNGTYYMWSADHVVSGGCGTDNTSVYQSKQYLGDKVDGDSAHDWAMVEQIGATVSGLVDHIDESMTGECYGVTGHMTYDGVKDHMNAGETVYQQGIATGTTTGTINEINTSDTSDCIDMDGYGISVSNDTSSGDSGGPIYARPQACGDVATIIGMSSIGSGLDLFDDNECNGGDMFNNTICWPAYRISAQGYKFGT